MPKLLDIIEYGHAVILTECPICGHGITVTADNCEPKTATCSGCGARFVPKIKSMEIEYEEVSPVDPDHIG